MNKTINITKNIKAHNKMTITLSATFTIISCEKTTEIIFPLSADKMTGDNFFDICKKHKILTPFTPEILNKLDDQNGLEDTTAFKKDAQIFWKIHTSGNEQKKKYHIEALYIEPIYINLEQLVNNLPGYIYWKDKSGVYLGCNHTQAVQAGFTSSKEIIGKTDYDMVWKAYADQLRKNDQYVMNKGELTCIQETICQADGQVKINLSYKFPLKNDAGKVIGILGNSLDITDVINIQKELENEKKRAKQSEIKSNDARNFLRNLFIHLPVTIYWKNLNGRYMDCNDSFAERVGFNSRNEIIGKNDYDLYTTKTANLHRSYDQKVIDTKKTTQVELPQYKEGKRETYKTYISPLLSNNNEIIGTIGSSFDITALKDKELALETIIANVPDHLFWVNLDGIIQGCNERQAISLGAKNTSEVIGKDLYEISELLKWDKSLIDKINENNQKVYKEGVTQTFEENALTPDGKMHTYLNRKSPIIDADNSIIGLVGISVDITERKEKEIKLQQAINRAEKANVAQSNFITNISHDLRTPLHTILGTAELLQFKPHNAEQAEHINNIIQAGNNLLQLVEDILNFSRVEEGPRLQKETDIDLLHLIETTTENFFKKAETKNIELLTYYADNTPRYITSYPQNITRILRNLLENAIKFTNSGHIIVTVETLSESKHHANLQLIVEDTGIGISKENIDHVFKRFYRATPSYTSHYKGTGLGLAIVQQLAKSMGGELSVNSQVGKGSTFYCVIPVKVSKKGFIRPKTQFNDAHILIIDDDLIRGKGLLQAFPHMKQNQVIKSNNVIDTISENAKNKPFNLIIIDDEITSITHSELAHHIRDNDDFFGHPLLVLCASTRLSHNNTKSSLRYYNRMLIKPVYIENIANQISVSWQKWLKTNKKEIPKPVLLNLSVLLVEDDPLIQKFTTSILKDFGCKITIANNGNEALQNASKHFDIVFMDLGLPDMDGLEATQKLRALYPKSEQPFIIALTAHASKEDKQRSLQAGLDDFLTKPASYNDFKNILMKFGKR